MVNGFLEQSLFLPLMASARRRAKKPPSSAGRGKALTTARLMLTMAANWNKPDRSDLAISEPTATMATGPVKFSAVLEKFVTICWRPAACHSCAKHADN